MNKHIRGSLVFKTLIALLLLTSCGLSPKVPEGSSEPATVETEDSTKEVTEETKEKHTVLNSEKYRKIACVGDSITFGAGATDRITGSYPARLQEKLGDQFTVQNFGYGGSSYVRTEINYKPYTGGTQYPESLDFQPDVVIIMLGTNDTHSWEETQPQFEEAVRALVRSYAALESKPVIFLCTPLCRYDNPSCRTIIYNEIIPTLEKVAGEEGCYFANVYKGTLGKGMYFSDGLHPNDSGYELLTDLIYDVLKNTDL